MRLGAMPESPIQRLVLNDVGPVLTAVSLERLSSYVGKWPPLPTIEAAELFVRSTSASFGPHTDADVLGEESPLGVGARRSGRTPTPSGDSSPSTSCGRIRTDRCACTTI